MSNETWVKLGQETTSFYGKLPGGSGGGGSGGPGLIFGGVVWFIIVIAIMSGCQ